MALVLWILLSFILQNINSDFYSCPIVTQHSDQWNNSIINDNPYSCQSVDCSFFSAALRSKYICDQWPFYTGFLPKWIETSHSYQCINIHGDDTNNQCNHWKSSNDDSLCHCIKMSSNNNYCAHYFCSNYLINYGSILTDDCNYKNKTISCPSNYQISSTENEDNDGKLFSNCWCELMSHTKNFCQRWYCEYYKYDHDKNEFYVTQTQWIIIHDLDVIEVVV